MDYIIDNLAVGNVDEAYVPPPDITALLCVAQEHDLEPVRCSYYKVPIVDMQPIPANRMVEAVRWIHSRINEERIMVFCNAGIGRSPSVVVGYLCCMRGYSFGDAVEYVASRRPVMSILPYLIKTIEDARVQLLLC